MALKPVIYRAKISLNDIDQNKYESLNLTVALHPSETLERMMMRIVAYCLNYQEFLTFTKGLSNPDDPDIILQSLTGETLVWIDIGEPNAERIKKSTRKARQAKVYSFNEKSNVWWAQERKQATQYPAEVYQFSWADVSALALLVERTMDISITITGLSAYLTIGNGEREIHWKQLE